MKNKKIVSLQTEPAPLEIDLERFALMVIDMQNAFVSKGGMFDLWGFDVSHIPNVIKPIEKLIGASREKGVKIIYLAHTLSPRAQEVGPMTRFWHSRTLRAYRERPEMADSLLTKGTWGAEIIDQLKPRDDDILIEKRRFSGFVGTDLDLLLRSFDIRYLALTGVATNICVESTLRDAFHLEYLPVLISDAAAASPASRQESTIANVIQGFGWVATTEQLLHVL